MTISCIDLYMQDEIKMKTTITCQSNWKPSQTFYCTLRRRFTRPISVPLSGICDARKFGRKLNATVDEFIHW